MGLINSQPFSSSQNEEETKKETEVSETEVSQKSRKNISEIKSSFIFLLLYKVIHTTFLSVQLFNINIHRNRIIGS